nr:rod-binding protein [Ruegeria marina]
MKPWGRARPETPASAIRESAVQLEAVFLAEMLKASGLGRARDGFGGGGGEEQFSSFLVQKQAEQMARAGGVGLAEAFFNAMAERQDET